MRTLEVHTSAANVAGFLFGVGRYDRMEGVTYFKEVGVGEGEKVFCRVVEAGGGVEGCVWGADERELGTVWVGVSRRR